MDGVSPVSGVGMRSVQLQAQYQARVMAKQQRAVADVGSAALKLIESAVVQPTDVGASLNVTA